MAGIAASTPTVQGLYINQFNTGLGPNTNPLQALLNDSSKWQGLWDYLNDNGYNYIILNDLNARANGGVHPTWSGVGSIADFIETAKANVAGLKVGGVTDLFYYTWNDANQIDGDYYGIRNLNATVAYDAAKKFDFVHTNVNFWDFDYSKSTSPDTNFVVTTTGAPTGYVRRATTTVDPSISAQGNTFFNHGGIWYQVIGISTTTYGGQTYPIYKITNTTTSTDYNTFNGAVKVYYDSKHTLPFSIYYSRLGLGTTGLNGLLQTVPLHNQGQNQDLGIELFVNIDTTGCNSVNLIREAAAITLTGNYSGINPGGATLNTYTRILFGSYARRPNYQNFESLLDAVYSGVTCGAADTDYDTLAVNTIAYSDFVAVQDMTYAANYLSFGFVVSAESGTLNSSCCSAPDYATSLAGTTSASTDSNFSGYWLEGRAYPVTGEYPLTGGLPNTNEPCTNCANQIAANFPPTVIYSPKTVQDAWDRVTQSGGAAGQTPGDTINSVNDDVTGDLNTYGVFDTVVLFDQERARQLSMGTVGGALLVQVVDAQNCSCFSICDGSLSISVQGGTAPYTYSWSGPNSFTSSSQNITGLCAGTYVCTITDAAMTTIDTGNIDITQPDEITVTSVITDDYCNNCNGSITLTPNHAYYTYSWTGPNSFTSTDQDITDLCAGSYNVFITDPTTGCTGNGTLEVPAGDHCFTMSPVVEDCTCSNSNDGVIALGAVACQVFMPPPPISVLWTGPNGYTHTNTGQNITGLAPGVYTILLTEIAPASAGCAQSTTVTVGAPDPITVQSNILPPTCSGAAGIFISNVAGGTAPYTYSWSTGATTKDLVDIGPGTYTVLITDANGCSTAQSFVIETDVQMGLEELKCCAAALAVKYVGYVRLGEDDKATCVLANLEYLYLVVRALTDGCYNLTECLANSTCDCESINELLQKTKEICKCDTCK